MNKSFHKILNIDSTDILKYVGEQSIDLVVTSPPYPMIKMWDYMFIPNKSNFNQHNGDLIFNRSMRFLNKIWKNIIKVLKDEGIICINIGDATRNFNNKFQLFNNHQKIVDFFLKNNFDQLPSIIWAKPTNSPNKFMGSGVLPVNAYITLEHEYILIFRKKKRVFTTKKEIELRRESSFFWEERNIWFNDIWKFNGTTQTLNIENSKRTRSGSYPIELPFRLINMFSIKGDTILDPFLGIGTTTLASITSERNSIGVEINKELCEWFKSCIEDNPTKIINDLNNIISNRIKKHIDFIKVEKTNKNRNFDYYNKYHNFYVKTKNEEFIKINYLSNLIQLDDGSIEASYSFKT